MAQEWMLHVVGEVEGCDAEIHFNDIPVARLLEHRGAAVSMPVNPLVASGTNELKLVLGPGPTPALARTPGAGSALKPGARAHCRLIPLKLGTEPSEQSRVLLEVTTVGRPSLPENGPLELSVTGQLPIPAPKPLWESAARIEWSPQVEQSALAFLTEVRDALQAGAVRRLAPLFRPRIACAAASYGLDGEQELDKFIQEWEAFARSPGWLLAPIDPRNASLRLCGNGRVIECVGTDWKPLIRLAEISRGGVFLGIGLGRLHDAWAIVR